MACETGCDGDESIFIFDETWFGEDTRSTDIPVDVSGRSDDDETVVGRARSGTEVIDGVVEKGVGT